MCHLSQQLLCVLVKQVIRANGIARHRKSKLKGVIGQAGRLALAAPVHEVSLATVLDDASMFDPVSRELAEISTCENVVMP